MTGTAFNQNTFNAYAYNDRSEVVGGQKFQGTDPNDKTNPIPSYDYDYNYDPIGNRQTFTESGTQTSYTANNLNQYDTITGLTDPQHDLDGNMTTMPTQQGDWTLEWNGENRLIAMETAGPAVDPVKLTFTYDYMGRRVRKQVFEWDDQDDLWSPTADLRYIYNNWNLIAQFSLQPSSLIPDKTYTWGLDLSQSRQGAGGVGGLLSVSDLGTPTSDLWYATYDANGNVSEYLAPDGTIAAHYEYSPFGQLTATGGTTPEAFDHRFSTKYLDGETKLYYYGYRYYSPELGRWVNRDPIWEKGGLNVFAFVGNRPSEFVDTDGRRWFTLRWLMRLIGEFLGSGANPQNQGSSSLRAEVHRGVQTCSDVRAPASEPENACCCCLIRVRSRPRTVHVGWGGDAVDFDLLSARLAEVECEQARFEHILISDGPDMTVHHYKFPW